MGVLKIFQFFSDFDTFSNSNVLFQKIIIILSFVPNSHSDPKYGEKTLFWTSVKFRIAIVFTIFLLHLKSFFFDLLPTKLNHFTHTHTHTYTHTPTHSLT